MTKPTVSEVLSNAFGPDFSGATQDQRLLLLETVSLCLRTGKSWQHMLHLVSSRTKASKMPPSVFPCIELPRNEGVQLLAVLNVAIVESYSVEAFNRPYSANKTIA